MTHAFDPEYDDLVGWLADGDDEWEVGGHPALLTADDADRAGRLMWRLRRTLEEAERVKAAARGEVQRILAWQDERLSPLLRDAEWLERALEGWCRMVHDRTGRQTQQLPSGTVSLRKASIKLVVVDDAVVEQAMLDAGRDDLLKPAAHRQLDKAAAKKALSVRAGAPLDPVDEYGLGPGEVARLLHDPDTGEVVPGVVVVTHESGFTCSVKPGTPTQEEA